MDELVDVYAPLVELQTELEKLQRGAELIGEAQHAATQILTDAKSMWKSLTQVLESLNALAVGVEDCVGTIAKVDFPSRLDEINATMSGIHTQLDRAQHALTGHLETQLGTTQQEMAHRFAELQMQLIREMTKNRYLIFAGLAVGLMTIGTLVLMR